MNIEVHMVMLFHSVLLVLKISNNIYHLNVVTMCQNLLLYVNKKALLCYNLCWSLLASWFLSDPCFIRQIQSFILQYMYVIFYFDGNIRVQVTLYFL